MAKDKVQRGIDRATHNEKVVQVTIMATGLQQNSVQRQFFFFKEKEKLAQVKHIRVRTGNRK